jgi:putative peptide zinc metalloprotease protein
VNLARLAARLAATGRSACAALRPRQPGPLDRPRLAPGVELIGEYEDSGFKESPYIVRRPDGQVVQLSRLLFLLAAEADGTRDLGQLATAVSLRFGRSLSPDNVAFLIDTKLRPAGLIGSRHGRTLTSVRRADPLLALRYRAAVVPPRLVRAAARMLRPLFMPLVVGAALSWLLALDIWLAGHGLSGAVRELFAYPVLLLALLGLVIVSAVWHELGHATACTYGGATPGAMGVGLYVIWPAFYTDVTDAYRLRRGGRLRTDLGGVYFNALFSLAAGGAYFATRFEPLLALVAVQHFQIIQQLTPLMRLDGYYVITDLVGVPDILSRVKPLLLSFLPTRAPSRAAAELKPWVRAATTAYILAFITALGALLVLLGVNTPHFVPTAVHSAERYAHRAATAWRRRALADAGLAEIQVFTVMLPAVGLALGASRLVRKLAHSAATRLDRRLRLGIGLALACGIAFGWPFFVQRIRPDLRSRDAQASIRHHGVGKHPASEYRAAGNHHGPPTSSAHHGPPTSSAQNTTAARGATLTTRTAARPASHALTAGTAVTRGPYPSTAASGPSSAAGSSPTGTVTSSGTTTTTPTTATETTTTTSAPATSSGGSASASPSTTGASSTTPTSTTSTQANPTTSSTDTAPTSTTTTP